MKIREVDKNKKQFISLLLLADEQENMIDRYIEKGTMYVLEDGNVKAECVVTDEDNGILEIKNIAVDPQNQGKGYGKALIDFLASKYADEYSVLQVGTGDSPLTIPFYEKCGFVRSHKIPNFFTDNYDHPIYEGVPIQNVAIPCADGIQKTTLGNDVLLKLLFFLKLQRRNFALELRVNFKLAQFHVGSPFRSFSIYGQWAERSSQTHIVSGNTCRHP